MRPFAPLLMGLACATACQAGADRAGDTKVKTPSAVTTTASPPARVSGGTCDDVRPTKPAQLGATMSVVARVRNRHASFYRRGLCEVVLEAGVFEYVGRKDGALQRVGDLGAYAKDVASDDMVGPSAGAPSRALSPPSHEEESAVDADGTTVTVRKVNVDLGDGPRETCSLVPSADGHVYATCRQGEVPLILRTPNAWVRVARAGALTLETTPHIAVARDGSVWAWENPKGLVRILPDGHKEHVSLPRVSEELARPVYDGSYPELMSAKWTRGADAGVHFWQTLHVLTPRAPEKIVALESLYPQADGSVWALGFEGGVTESMVLFTSGPAPAAPFEIGTPFDQQNEVRNTKEPRPWTGSGCPQVFVVFDVASHEREVAAALTAKSYGFSVAVVRGRIGPRTESGVLLLRTTPESDPAILDTNVERLLHVDGAKAFCAAPVLERLVQLPGLEHVVQPRAK